VITVQKATPPLDAKATAKVTASISRDEKAGILF
jgi:hypothetical protein